MEQDPSAYDEIDQAVWRFVLLQMHDRGIESAHPAYVRGLAETGMSVERIPSIAEMDACLSRFGWGAVAVDGFIPPRAFQEFQSLGILTIAAEIRRPEHLAYTPAPDIIHESAGHAPILPEPRYRDFLRRIGEVGARAFSSREDQRVYEAIHVLSELKENRESSPEQLERANVELADSLRSVSYATEAALISRLHWWTVEYGLIGRPDDYKIYGAGLLSSLGESHFLNDPRVRKLPLTAQCIDVGYDITEPQPQLFVAESFDQLHDVLDQVSAQMSQQRGGAVALERAVRAGEVSTLELSSGLELIGVPDRIWGTFEDPAYLRLSGECALARGGRLLAEQGRAAHPTGYGAPLGRLVDGSALESLRASDLARYAVSGDAHRIELCFRSGVRVNGTLEYVTCEGDRLSIVTLSDCRVTRGDELLFAPEWGRYDLAVGEHLRRAYAGPSDPAYWPDTQPSRMRVPRAKRRSANEARLHALYRRALELWTTPLDSGLLPGFERIHSELVAELPQDWLLRWNLLECLRKVGRNGPLGDTLRRELLEIEKRAPRDLPITTGMRYLDRRYPSSGH